MDGSAVLADITKRYDELLAAHKALQDVIDTRVVSVALRYSPGLLLFGRPGTGKTHLVTTALKRLEREEGTSGTFLRKAGKLTARAFFETIEQNPDKTIVLDDVVGVFERDEALGILLAATDRPALGDHGRVVEYGRAGSEERAVFTGGIVSISNRRLRDGGLPGAFKSRAVSVEYDPPNEQVGAQMLALAGLGFPLASDAPAVNPGEAREVAEHLIREMARVGRPFDLRLYLNAGLPDFMQWKDGQSRRHWRTMVTQAVEEKLDRAEPAGGTPATRGAKNEETKAAVLKFMRQPFPTEGGRVDAFREATGLSHMTFYRWKRVLSAEGRFRPETAPAGESVKALMCETHDIGDLLGADSDDEPALIIRFPGA